MRASYSPGGSTLIVLLVKINDVGADFTDKCMETNVPINLIWVAADGKKRVRDG